jgi:CDGSH-type Zn-finger protein
MSQPISAQKSPYAVVGEAGREYWWCACGRSKSQPFCDGSHRGIGITPAPFTVAEAQEIWLCGWKGTGTKPFCDGSHNRL